MKNLRFWLPKSDLNANVSHCRSHGASDDECGHSAESNGSGLHERTRLLELQLRHAHCERLGLEKHLLVSMQMQTG